MKKLFVFVALFCTASFAIAQNYGYPTRVPICGPGAGGYINPPISFQCVCGFSDCNRGCMYNQQPTMFQCVCGLSNCNRGCMYNRQPDFYLSYGNYQRPSLIGGLVQQLLFGTHMQPQYFMDPYQQYQGFNQYQGFQQFGGYYNQPLYPHYTMGDVYASEYRNMAWGNNFVDPRMNPNWQTIDFCITHGVRHKIYISKAGFYACPWDLRMY